MARESIEATAGYTEVNGARLYYEVAGQGHPLLMVHAGIADSRMWDDQFAFFARRFRVVRFDVRGFGRSMMPPDEFALHEDLYVLLRNLGIGSAFVMGCSMGGASAIELALAHPEAVDALVLVCSGLGGFEPSEELEDSEAEERRLLQQGDLEGAAEESVRIWVDGPNRSPDQVDRAVRDRVRQMQLHAYTTFNPEARYTLLDPPAISRLSEIRVPVLILQGDRDQPDVIRVSEILSESIRGARKVVIPDTAHLPNLERPEEFNRIVLEFLSEIG